jgi:hypothetical protein
MEDVKAVVIRLHMRLPLDQRADVVTGARIVTGKVVRTIQKLVCTTSLQTSQTSSLAVNHAVQALERSMDATAA